MSPTTSGTSSAHVDGIALDLGETPFACFGGYMTLGRVPLSWNCPGLLLRGPQGVGSPRELFRVELCAQDQWLEPETQASPTKLIMCAKDARLTALFQSPEVLRISGQASAVRLSSLNNGTWHAIRLAEDCWQLNPFALRMQYVVTALAGSLAIECCDRHLVVTCRPDARGNLDLAIEECQSTSEVTVFPAFSVAGDRTAASWRRWQESHPPVSAEYRDAATKAAYVNWSATVDPRGPLTRPTMLMSKNWMNNCWTWDHCFNAIALSCCPGLQELAWDQLQVPFDHQDSHGCLPDSVSSFQTAWSAVKPPIHGWTLRLMRRNMTVTSEQLAAFYPNLAAWTRWWLDHRDTDGDGIPEYFNGCDSGWDNATVFDGQMPVATPDLPAFLIIQMDVLSELAAELGKPDEAQAWTRRADAMLDDLLRLWRGDRFMPKQPDGVDVPHSEDCLLNLMPIVLGDRLPQAQRDHVATQLRAPGRFLTNHGLATQCPSSAAYEPDGYWRGPIWAPEVMLIWSGLQRGGYHAQADDLARRFCAMCSTSGFAENFNALTGNPLRDPAYTWTASAFLVMAWHLARNACHELAQ